MKKRPTWSTQIAYHLSQDRGTWEIPLSTFQRAQSGSVVVAPRPKDAPEPLVVPGLLKDVEAATSERQRALCEAVADRGQSRGLREVLVVFGAVIAGITSALTVTAIMSDLGLSDAGAALLKFAVMPLTVLAFIGAWQVFGAPNRELEVSRGVWDERLRLYDERIEELRRRTHVNDAASAVRGRGSAGWYVSWGRDR